MQRFDNLDDAQRWLQETFAAWAFSLTAAERSALRNYKYEGHATINEALRSGTLGGDEQETVDDLDLALSRMRLPVPVVVYRGLPRWVLATPASELEALVGEAVCDVGFVSTSLLRDVALPFLRHADSPVLAEIVVPGGAAAGAFAGAPDLIVEMQEAEILLPRGSEFEIGATRPATRTRPYETIEMEVLP